MEPNTSKLNEDDKERLDFIRYWVDYIKTHSDEEWSRQQNIVINNQFNNLSS